MENYVVTEFPGVFACKKCGCMVSDYITHDAWHKSINLIATDLYGVDTEID